jgi:hypothetical protein
LLAAAAFDAERIREAEGIPWRIAPRIVVEVNVDVACLGQPLPAFDRPLIYLIAIVI